jgi:hypothetical protein
LSPVGYVLLFWSLVVFHGVVMWFGFLRARFVARVTGRAQPPLPWFVWVAPVGGLLGIYAAIAFTTLGEAVDTSWFMLVSTAVLGIGSLDFTLLSRSLAARSGGGREGP